MLSESSWEGHLCVKSIHWKDFMTSSPSVFVYRVFIGEWWLCDLKHALTQFPPPACECAAVWHVSGSSALSGVFLALCAVGIFPLTDGTQAGIGEDTVWYHKAGECGLMRDEGQCVDTWGRVQSEGMWLIAVSVFRHCGADKRARPKSVGPMMGKCLLIYHECVSRCSPCLVFCFRLCLYSFHSLWFRFLCWLVLWCSYEWLC